MNEPLAQPPRAGDASSAPTSSPTAVTIIRPQRGGWLGLDLRELWEYRELFGFMVWRDIKVKYKQTLLGFAWAILVPFTQMIVFSFIFGRLAGLPSDGLPKPIFYYAGLLPWTYFSTSLSLSSNSLVNSANFLTKIYFPRLIIPASPCIAGLVDFVIASSILAAMMAWYRVVPASTAVLLPLLILIAFGSALGCGLFLASLNVRYRDVRHITPFIVQLWMYCTVIIPFSRMPDRFGPWRYLYGLNPMAGVVEGFRWCLLHPHMTVKRVVEGQTTHSAVEAPWMLLAVGAPVMVAMLAVGSWYFRRTERQFADIV